MTPEITVKQTRDGIEVVTITFGEVAMNLTCVYLTLAEFAELVAVSEEIEALNLVIL